MYRHEVKSPLAGILSYIDCCDAETHISPNSHSFPSVCTAPRVPVVVPSTLHILARLIAFPSSFAVSRFMEFSPGDFE